VLGGCDRLDVLAELRARGLLDGRTDYRPVRPPHPAGRDHGNDDGRRIARALAIWRDARDPQGTPAARYLAGRGIVLDHWPASLRYHARCSHPHGEPMPGMVALVEHVARGIIGIHRTYITPDYRRHDRATLGPIGGGAIRLGMPSAGEWFAVGEGIETTLSVMVPCSMPGWAALSEGGIRTLVLPLEATHIVICADHDASGTGERAAHDAAERWLAEGRRVRIAMPPEPSSDFNDIIKTEAHHVAA
jgi:putative DNA primase/helicase